MKTRVFSYKGNLGVETDPENGKFLNNPMDPGKLGCVVHCSEVLITPSAKELLKNAGREGGSFAPIMLTKHGDGSGSSLGVLGIGKCHLGSDFRIGRDCDKSVIDDFEVEDFEVPEDYKQFVDELGNEEMEEDEEEEDF